MAQNLRNLFYVYAFYVLCAHKMAPIVEILCAHKTYKHINIKPKIAYVEPATSVEEAATAASPIFLHITAAILIVLLLSPALLRNHGSVFSL